MLASHVSLFSALFSCYQQSGFQNPFPITRKSVMGFSKTASIATYHKCMKDLDAGGYISYRPSFHPGKGSLVYWSEKEEIGRQNISMISLPEQSTGRQNGVEAASGEAGTATVKTILQLGAS